MSKPAKKPTPVESPDPTPVESLDPPSVEPEDPRIDAIRRAIEPLADLKIPDPSQDPNSHSISDRYEFQRADQHAVIAPKDIEAARRVRVARVTFDQAVAALEPLARLPLDPRHQRKEYVVFALPGDAGQLISITRAHIEEARALVRKR